MNINRLGIIDQLSEKYGYKKKYAQEFLHDFSEVIMENLENGNTVSIHDFGVFDIVERAGRNFKNVQNGEMMYVEARFMPKFFPSKRMKIAVSKWADNEARSKE